MEEAQKPKPNITCPACGKGHLREGGIGYVCDYFVNAEDMCKFVIYRSMFGHVMTEDDVMALSRGEAIGEYELTRKDGSTFTASLQYDPATGSIAPVFSEPATLEGVLCTRCGGDIRAGARYFACENSSKEAPGHVFFSRVIAGVEIADETAVALVRGEPTDYFKFTKKDGGEFTARLRIVDGEVKFDSTVCKCPACGGTVMIGDKSYYCSLFKQKPCDFFVFKEMGGRAITPDIVETLCQKGETEIMEFTTKDGRSIQRKIILNSAHHAMLV
jgi:hypothetical protein